MPDHVSRNEQIYRTMIDRIWNQPEPDWEHFRRTMASNYHARDANFPRPDPEQGLKVQQEFRRSMKDARYEVLSVFGQGHQLCARWRLTGTFVGPLLGHAVPEGRAVAFDGISINEFDDEGRIVQGWIAPDYLQLFRQAGLEDLRLLATRP